MYRVYVSYDGTEYPLYEPLDDEMRIFDPVFTETAGSAGTFVFQIHASHPNFDKIKACKSEIILYRDDEALFYGRVFRPELEFNNIVTFTCEGELTYLLDSMQRPFSFAGSISAYFGKLLEIHNSQVQADKRVELGNIVVTGDGGDSVRTLTKYTPTLTVIRKIKDTYGGYLRIRHESGKRYLDYLWDYGGVNSQVVRFGENLLDLTKYVDASQIITCLIPVGGEIEYKDALGERQKRAVDITSVNGGKDYIENAIAVEKYGRIWGTRKFDGVTDPQKLLAKATAYLEEASTLPESVVVSAIDLSLIEADVEQFHVGYWTDVSSSPHGIEQRYMLSSRVINLLDPAQGSITLGRELDTFTGNANKAQAAISARVEKVAQEAIEEIDRKVENATELITGGLGGYVVLDNIDPATGEQMHPWRILVMNTPDKATATNIIQINQNGIGFSTTGINGPYRNAWTIDGNLVADFITTGIMLSDRVKGGTLEIGGKGFARDGKIEVYNADGRQIGYWDKTGLHVYDGVIEGSRISGGTIAVGPLSADKGGVYFGDYYVSADGSNEFNSENGWIRINTNGRPVGSPGKDYSSLFIGGDGYNGVKINGTGEVSCGGINCSGDVYASGCQLAQGSSRLWGLGETIDWMWEEIQKLKAGI